MHDSRDLDLPGVRRLRFAGRARRGARGFPRASRRLYAHRPGAAAGALSRPARRRLISDCARRGRGGIARSEEHTSELQSLMRISYAVFCLKKKKKKNHITQE